MRYVFFFFFALRACAGFAAAPDNDTNHIPLSRQSWHESIHTEQVLCDKLDGRVDGELKAGSSDAVNARVTEALMRKPNEFRNWIEANDSLLPANNDKIRFLRYVSEVLYRFRLEVHARTITIAELPVLLDNFEIIMKAKAGGNPVIPLLQFSSFPIAKINAQIFYDGPEKDSADAVVYLKYAMLHPENILNTIAPYADQPYADSLIVLACHANPVQFYSFAQSPESPVGKLIHRNTDKMVSLVASLSSMDNALFYFPFLDDLLNGRKTIPEIQKFTGDGYRSYDSVGYYNLLVNTAVEYARRMAPPLRDTPVAYFGDNGLWKTLYKMANRHFITPINELHDENNLSVRMRAIQPLTPQGLYYMLVAGENDIYTSSYKHSFDRLLQLMAPKPHGDSLLLSVNFDHFRKFIKMAANYNKLDTFLRTMPPSHASFLMKTFTAHLDNKNLEDAVDVADSYSSITDPKLRRSMLENVAANEQEAIAENNRSGKIVYGLLKTIFLSGDPKSTVDLTSQLGIPSVYGVSNSYLQDNKGRIVEQVFFYGDKDGRTFYPAFRNSFNNKNWKITESKEWMEAVSAKGNVFVYANKPLDSDANLDDSAQVHLVSYLEDKGMRPSIIVHRGHSYWLKGTMSRMPGDAKVVVLGSCGGYQNLNEILEINPDAHIISTKEIGTGDINGPILNYMNTALAAGADISWPKMWQALSKDFAHDAPNVRESWDDYIPPYKNLGAIFLKAYSRQTGE